MHTKFQLENIKKTDHAGSSGTDQRILKWNLEEYEVGLYSIGSE